MTQDPTIELSAKSDAPGPMRRVWADFERRGKSWAQRWRGLSLRQRLIIGGGAGALALALVVSAVGLTRDTPEMTTAAVSRASIEQAVLATGILEPARLVSVGSQASGQVKRLHVTLGQEVRAGDLIAEIDSTTQQNDVQTAAASLQQVRAQRAEAAARLRLAERTFARQTELLAGDAISRADYDTAEAELAAQRATVAAYDAQIASGNVSLSTARANLGYTRIVAPMSGTIVAIVTEEGQTVNANQSAPTIVKLAQLDTMTVSAEISEADVARVVEGQTVYFTTLGDASERHYAQLRAVEPAPNSIESDETVSTTDTAVYFDGLFDVQNEDRRLRTGMTAQVSIVLASAENALVIPSSALGARDRTGAYSVQVVKPGGGIEQRQVRIGINNNVSAQVLDGLSEGERVVVAQASANADADRSNQQARPGMMMGAPSGGGPPQ